MKVKKSTLSQIFFISLALSACSPSNTTEEYIKEANGHVESGKVNVAIISLKRAIQESPEKIAPRKALAHIYLNTGMGAEAEKEFLRVIQYSGDINKVIPGILKAYELQGKSEALIEILDKLSELTPENQIAAYVYSSIGYIAKGDVVSANVSLESALEFSSESIYQDLGRAYFELNKQNVAAATNIVQTLISDHPNFTEATFLLAQLKFIAEDYQQAIDLFIEYKKTQVKDVRVNFILADALLRSNRYEEAEQEIDPVLLVFPQHPLANQIKGIARFNLEDYEQAESHLTKSIQNGFDSTGNRLMAGVSAFNLKRYETSYNYLKSIRNEINKEHPALKLLVSLQLLLGYVSEANATLTDLPTLNEADSELLTMTSFELLKLGKKEEAKKLLQQSISAKNFDPLLISKQAALKLQLNAPKPFKDLETVLGNVPEHSQANIIYISGLFAKGQTEEALAAAKKWQNLQPESLISNLMIASTYRKLDDKMNALKHYTIVANLDPKHISLNLYQSELAEKNQDFLKAITFIDKILEDHPDNIAILAKHLQLSVNVNIKTTAKSLALVKSSYSRNNNDPYLTLLYARSLYVNKDYEAVIELLSKVTPKSGNTYKLEYWTLLGQSYLQTKKIDKAIQIFTLWTKIEPESEKSWLALALTLDSTNKGLADNIAEEGLKNNTDSYALRVLAADLLLKNKKNVKAEIILKNFTKEQQKSFWYKGLWGRFLLTRDEYKNALNYLIPSYNERPDAKTAAYIMAAYFDLKQINEGTSFMEKHLETYGNDFQSQMLLATTLMKFNKNASIKHYSSLLTKQPKNIIAMNNISWLLYEKGQYQRSEKIIDVALKLVPKSPNILDTAGMVKIQLGKKDEGIMLLERARELAPDNLEIKRHYLDAINSNI